MDNDETIRLLSDAVADEFEIDKAVMSPDALIMADIGLDSLDMVDLAVIVDRIFGIKLTREDMAAAHTLGELANLIDARRKKN